MIMETDKTINCNGDLYVMFVCIFKPSVHEDKEFVDIVYIYQGRTENDNENILNKMYPVTKIIIKIFIHKYKNSRAE